MPRSPFRGTRSLRRSLPAALFLLLLVPALALAQANGKLQIHHIDVGQGDGMLLVSPQGETALFDDGNYLNCSGIKSYLQGLGITTVDYHFNSHYHADHLGCLDDLAAIGITIGTYGYDRGYSYSSASYTSYVNTLGSKRRTIARGQTITLDAGAANPVTITCVDLNGAGVYSPSGSDENAKSVVLKVSYGAFDQVIGGDLTGDASTDVETTIGPMVGDVEVYKVHHHGSRYSTNDNWLNAVTPEVGIIQVGDGNSYGHPTADALTRLHNHGVMTYWNETGAGASPSPSWDTVADGTIVVEADPGEGATFTVSGPGFSDSYTNGGGSPPVIITETVVASAMTMLKGSISTGDVTRLAVNDAVRVSVSAGVESRRYVTDWYGSAVLAHPPVRLEVTYDGNYTVSQTQTLYLWNWSTSAWVQVDQATVGTTDVTRTWSTTSPGAYVSPAGEVQLRVRGSLRKQGSYTSRGDYMAFTYDYQEGTGITITRTEYAMLRERAERETPLLTRGLPLRVEARGDRGVELTWAVGYRQHVDGFNVYREDETGQRVHVGTEARIEVTSDEVVFQWADAAAGPGTYWLGARSCSGPEAMVGPIRVEAAPVAAGRAVALAVSPNPAQGATHLTFTLEREGEVRLDVYDLSGRRVATPFAGRAPAGPTAVEWNLRSADGSDLPAGIYFARLEAPGRTTLARVSVIK